MPTQRETPGRLFIKNAPGIPGTKKKWRDPTTYAINWAASWWKR